MYLNETKWSFEENFQSVSRNFLKEFKVFKRSMLCFETVSAFLPHG